MNLINYEVLWAIGFICYILIGVGILIFIPMIIVCDSKNKYLKFFVIPYEIICFYFIVVVGIWGLSLLEKIT